MNSSLHKMNPFAKSFSMVAVFAMALLLLCDQAYASTVQVTDDFKNIITGSGQGSWTKQYVITDGTDSATIDVTISTPSGVWLPLDTAQRFSIDSDIDDDNAFNDATHEANWIFGAGEVPTFTANLVSTTAGSVGFNVESLAILSIFDGIDATWESSVTGSLLVQGIFGTGQDVNLDTPTSFHLISSSNYVGTLTDNSAGNGDDFIYRLSDDTDAGLVFNVEFSAAAIPEPSAYALGLIGLAGLGLIGRRRRKRIADC